MDGSEGQIVSVVKGFAKRVQKRFPDTPIIFQDERLSTSFAEELLNLKNKNREKEKKSGRLDAAAAAVILENFMQKQAFTSFRAILTKEL